MIRIRIAQCLCGPARHAIMAMALGPDTDAITDAQAAKGLREVIEALVAGRGGELNMGLPPRMNAWCGICGAPARDWAYEIGRSIPFTDWEDAQRVLRENETAQNASRRLLDLLDQTFDAKVRNPGGSTH